MSSETDIHSGTVADQKAPSARRSRRAGIGRTLLVWLAWGGGAGLVAAGMLFLGWRYGLTPLPPPITGLRYEPTPSQARRALGPENCWYWAREVDRLVQTMRAEGPRQSPAAQRLTSDPWARTEARSGTNRTEVERWFAESAELDSILARAVTTTENQPPAQVRGAEIRAMGLLTHLPVVRAADRDRAGRTAAALEFLLDAWRLQARLVPHVEFPGLLDERGLGELDHKLGKPWRRLTAAGAGLSAVEGRAMLRQFPAITNALPDLSVSYQRIVAAWRTSAQPLRGADWRRVRRAFSQAIALATQDLVQIPPALWARMSGYGVSFTHMEGIGHFGRPFVLLGESFQRAVLRSTDLDTAIHAATSQALGRLLANDAESLEKTPPGFWQRWLDRPALWRTLRALPDEGDLLRSQRYWLMSFETCRLALALRIYREENGDWPPQLEALTPGILERLPADPRSGRAFGYERTPTGWRLWSPEREPARLEDQSAREADGRLVFEALDD